MLSVQRLDDGAATGKGPTVWANPAQLQTILSNLLSNALKFTPEGGSVRVTITADSDTVRVSVRDSGPGIPAADLPHVFDRFYRTEAAHPYGQAGSRIGLALTKELVDLHRGTLKVDREEGFGSQFTLSLPRGRDYLQPDEIMDEGQPCDTIPEVFQVALLPVLDDRDEAVASPVTDPSDGLSENASNAETMTADKTTVLLVEDNAEVRAYIRMHLSKDYRLIEASNGWAGLDHARADLPDLVLSDVMMPEMDGIELCQALKSSPKPISSRSSCSLHALRRTIGLVDCRQGPMTT